MNTTTLNEAKDVISGTVYTYSVSALRFLIWLHNKKAWNVRSKSSIVRSEHKVKKIGDNNDLLHLECQYCKYQVLVEDKEEAQALYTKRECRR